MRVQAALPLPGVSLLASEFATLCLNSSASWLNKLESVFIVLFGDKRLLKLDLRQAQLGKEGDFIY